MGHSFLQEESDNSDKTGRMPGLTQVIDVRMFLIYTNSAVPNQMAKKTQSLNRDCINTIVVFSHRRLLKAF